MGGRGRREQCFWFLKILKGSFISPEENQLTQQFINLRRKPQGERESYFLTLPVTTVISFWFASPCSLSYLLWLTLPWLTSPYLLKLPSSSCSLLCLFPPVRSGEGSRLREVNLSCLQLPLLTTIFLCTFSSGCRIFVLPKFCQLFGF